jgi:hypothetical protein
VLSRWYGDESVRKRSITPLPERHRAENDDIEQQFRRILQSPDIPLERRVRMACSIGTVVGTLATGEAVFGDVPMEELAALVRGAVSDLLG